MMKIAFDTSIWILDEVKKVSEELLGQSLKLLLTFYSKDDEAKWKYPGESLTSFIANLKEQELWKLVFLTLKKKNEDLNRKVNSLFKVLIETKTDNFKKSIDSMLIEIIKKSPGSLYLRINPNLSDDLWMNHLHTILEYLSMANSKLFLDTDTALCLLDLPLTTGLWSLALHIIPIENVILEKIIQIFPPEYYAALGKEITAFC